MSRTLFLVPTAPLARSAGYRAGYVILLASACGGTSGAPVGHDAGARDAKPVLEGSARQGDAGKGRDASESACGPTAVAFDGGGPATHLGVNGAACTRDIDCADGTFCIVVQGVCLGSMLQGSGAGGLRGDAGCVAAPAFASTCDSVSVEWSAPLGVSASKGSLAESDTALATDGKGKIVIAWANNMPSGDLQTNGLSVSNDDGKSFTTGVAPIHAATDAENDAQLAIDANGLIYYVWEGYASAEMGAQHVYSSTSSDATTWSPALQIDAPDDDTNGTTPEDFPFVAINPVNQNPYFTYQITSNAGAIPLRLVVGTTADDAGTGRRLELDDGTRPNAYRDLANGAFDQKGSFYAAWGEFVGSSYATGEGLENGSVGDGIFTTRIDLSASGTLVPLGHDVQASGSGEAVAFGLPRVLVTPDASSVYILYTVGTNNALDLRLATSHDRGATFLPSVKVNDDATCATHFKAAAVLDGDARLWVMWYDNRDGAGHMVYSVSDDGGASFHPNRLVTPYAFPFETFEYSVGWLGDYFPLAASKTKLYAAWPDPHVNDQSHVYFASAILPP